MDKITNYLEEEFGLSPLDKIKLRYSIEFLINDISKLLILFVLFYILGKRTDFIYSVIALQLIRPFTGGLHFKTYTSCLVFTGIFFATSILLNTYINLDSFFIILFIFSLTTIFLIAPIPSKNRPNYSNKKQLQFKLRGLTVLIIHFIAYIIVNKHPYLNNAIWVLVLQSFQLLIKKGVDIYEKNVNYQKIT